jgi:hypothetical protein
MKKVILILLAAVLAGSFAFGQVSARGGQFGLQGGVIFTSIGANPEAIGVKYMINDAIALRADVGIKQYSSSVTSNTQMVYDLGVGLEYHFAGKGGVSPYIGALFNYSSESFSPSVPTPSDLGIMALFGGEFFFSSNFSWAGEARVGFDTYKAPSGATSTTIGTYGFATFLTYYFN